MRQKISKKRNSQKILSVGSQKKTHDLCNKTVKHVSLLKKDNKSPLEYLARHGGCALSGRRSDDKSSIFLIFLHLFIKGQYLFQNKPNLIIAILVLLIHFDLEVVTCREKTFFQLTSCLYISQELIFISRGLGHPKKLSGVKTLTLNLTLVLNRNVYQFMGRWVEV